MTGPDRPRKHSKQDADPEKNLRVEGEEKAKKTTRDGKGRKPAFRFSRLDGRDTLKYEDTADK